MTDTLSYAARLAGVTAAPPEFSDKLEPEQGKAHWPFPDEGMIRRGAFAMGPVALMIPPPPEPGQETTEPTDPAAPAVPAGTGPAEPVHQAPVWEEAGDDAFDLDL